MLLQVSSIPTDHLPIYVIVLLSVLGSSVVSGIINSLFNKKKTDKEIETIVVKNYESIITRMSKELDRTIQRIDDLEKKEALFIQNSNLLLKDKLELTGRILKLETDNRLLHAENKKLKEKIEALEKKHKSPPC